MFLVILPVSRSHLSHFNLTTHILVRQMIVLEELALIIRRMKMRIMKGRMRPSLRSTKLIKVIREKKSQ